MRIGTRRVGIGQPCFIIAEAGVNHNGSIELAKKLIDAAAAANVDAVKFQTFTAEKLVTKEAPQAEYQVSNTGVKESQYDMLKRLELSEEAHGELKRYAEEKGLIFLSTPFDEDAIDFLDTLGVPAFKAGSGELNNLPYFAKMVKKKKPIIFSVGMASLDDVHETVRFLRGKGQTDFVMLHCTSNYPCPLEDANLRAMETLRDTFNCLVGYSDHTEGIVVPLTAAAMGAVVIEKHFTLDKTLPGPDHKASLDPYELAEMVRQIRLIEQVRGSAEKKVSSAEEKVAAVARKSLVMRTPLPAGTVLRPEHLTIKRPGTGIPPSAFDDVIGRELRVSVSADTCLLWDMLASVPAMPHRKKILYVSGTRADYGLMKNTLRAISHHPSLSLTIVATGMHLMGEFGFTLNEIIEDGFSPVVLPAFYAADNRASMAAFLSSFIEQCTPLFSPSSSHRPDLVVVLGDRAEMLGAALTATYLGIPLVHIHGGEITSTVDEHARHAITKLAQFHCAATPQAAQRIIAMGESPDRVHVVGAPGLDGITSGIGSREEIEKTLGIPSSRPYIIVLQHPVSTDNGSSHSAQIRVTIEAALLFSLPVVIIYPNADAGGRAMIETIEQYRNNPLVHIFPTIERTHFLSLLAHAAVLVGNSSAGIIEAPSFHLPVVNIGLRQDQRERAENVIDAVPELDALRAAIDHALHDLSFKQQCASCINPYGDGIAGEKIVNLLATLPLGIVQKQLMPASSDLPAHDRFEHWKPPLIDDGKLTQWNWMVQNKDGLMLGSHTDIGAFTYINAKYGVEIQDDVQIGSHCSIYSVSTIDDKNGKITLKKNCCLGSHSVVMPGVTVGENTLVGAFSFVNKDLPDNVIAVGVPARIVKNREKILEKNL